MHNHRLFNQGENRGMSRVTDPHTYARRRVLAADLALSAVGGFTALRYGGRFTTPADQVKNCTSEAPPVAADGSATTTASMVGNHAVLPSGMLRRITTTPMNSAGTKQLLIVDRRLSHSS